MGCPYSKWGVDNFWCKIKDCYPCYEPHNYENCPTYLKQENEEIKKDIKVAMDVCKQKDAQIAELTNERDDIKETYAAVMHMISIDNNELIIEYAEAKKQIAKLQKLNELFKKNSDEAFIEWHKIEIKKYLEKNNELQAKLDKIKAVFYGKNEYDYMSCMLDEIAKILGEASSKKVQESGN